ncbi:EAL domain-containing protein [Sulfurimonas sp. HSL3-2]|uniref:bifunctional diguanylate cyclase/phosphodiesterase n=1 Tax=Hydrocurvibacter mobilis TaxID=3131936 RepID=UPI0031FA38F0
MNEYKLFKNTIFHIFALFILITVGRLIYDYKSTVHGEYQFVNEHRLSLDHEKSSLEKFYNSASVDILSLFVIFVVMSLLVARYNRSNRFLNHSLLERTQEVDSQNKFLSSYLQALDSSSVLTKTDKNGVITYANDKFLEETGFDYHEVIGKTHNIIRHPETSDEMYEDMWKTIKAKKVWSAVIKGLKKDKNTTFISKVSIIPIVDKDDKIVEFLSPRVDITELVEKKEELERSLVTDNLTNLPNRNQLIKDVIKYDELECINLALINIDRFKEINDFYGYDIADKVLLQVAYKLQDLASKIGFKVYKLPSDEYAVFSSTCGDPHDFHKYIKGIIDDLMQTKFEIKDQEIIIHVSCGIATNARPIMVKADMALQRAKSSKKNLVEYDDSLDMEKNISENIKGISMIKSAIKNNQIVPYFQPIYNLETNKIEKYESLARIVEDDSNVILPLSFIDIAIKSKLYPNITRAILFKTFEFFKDKDYEFSINCSMEDISNRAVVQYILDNLKEFKHPEKVVFELLETEEVKDYKILKDFIDQVKKFGSKIAVDDFGSGYSNFAHILELNIDYLKIDSSLVRNILTDRNSKIITQSIINFAKDMGVKTIAEFVEDKESMELLREMGADYIQGYYIGEPTDGLNYS